MNLYELAVAKALSGSGGGGGEPVIEALSVTENGTYTAPSGVNGYSPVTVNVSGGGSSYTLLYSGEITTSTTSTSATVVDSIIVPGIDDPDCFLYVKIVDKAGKRSNYFFRGETIYMKSDSNDARAVFCYSMNGTTLNVSSSTTGNGIFASGFNVNNNTITISQKYSSNSKNIDGTYSIEVYKCSFPNDDSPVDAA